MNVFEPQILLGVACQRIRRTASKGIWDGKGDSPYLESCRWLLPQYPCTIVFTRETGYHSSGWWKNPEYERCWHLSISFRDGSNKATLEKILTFLFGEKRRWLWVEPPNSDQGKKLCVWHYRLFCDENWFAIKPRGEVYDTHFTEKGWKSFSDLNKL